MRRVWLLVLASCASASEPTEMEPAPPEIAAGTFCVTIDGVESCAPREAQAFTQTETNGNRWFRASARIPAGEIELFGQVPEGAPLPRAAEEVVITVPLEGSCTVMRRTSPFSPACTDSSMGAMCPARTVYDDSSAIVTVLRLDEGAVELELQAWVSVALPDDCCAPDPECGLASASFTPAEAIPVEGRVHVTH